MFEQNLKIENVTMNFNSNSIFKNLNFECKGPGLLFVQGANGAGKTTLLKIISGLLIPSSGTCKVNQVKSYSLENKMVTSLFALSNGLIPEWSGRTHLEWVDKVNGIRQQESANHFLNDFNLGNDILMKKASEYSSSMQQLLKLTMAFQQKRPFLVLDEPFIYLSNSNKDVLKKKILQASQHSLVIISLQDTIEELVHQATTLKVGAL